MSEPLSSPLSDPKWGLAWSNPHAPVSALVQNALLRGHYDVILEAVHAHGFDYVEAQWAVLLTEQPTVARFQNRLDRMLDNIRIGFERARTQN